MRRGLRRTDGRILEPPPDRGCVRRTSRSKCGCPESLSCPKTPGLAVPLRLVLRTQPRSVPVLWWWYQDGPEAHGRILEPPPDRGCVRRTSRSKCGCPESLSCPKTPGLAVP